MQNVKAYWRVVAVLLRVKWGGRVGNSCYASRRSRRLLCPLHLALLLPWFRLLFPFCDLARAPHASPQCMSPSAASPENPIAVARKHARPIKYRRPRQGAAGAHERIVLPLKIFVGDGIGLKILFADQLLSQPITRRSPRGLDLLVCSVITIHFASGAALRRTYQSFLRTLLPLQVNLPSVFSVIK